MDNVASLNTKFEPVERSSVRCKEAEVQVELHDRLLFGQSGLSKPSTYPRMIQRIPPSYTKMQTNRWLLPPHGFDTPSLSIVRGSPRFRREVSVSIDILINIMTRNI